jgi:general L-amino acid transport system permease protein
MIPFWRDSRVLKIVGQVIVLAIVLGAIAFFAGNLVENFQSLNQTFGFDFLSRPASFGIGDPPISYLPTDPYSRAILVGLINSLRVMFLGIILATIIGVSVGIGKLSDNWLVRQIATVYVEVLRNTPLLLQLFFWYFAVFLKLPRNDNPLVIGDRIFFSNSGLNLPWVATTLQTWLCLALIVVAIVLEIVIWRKRLQTIETGRSGRIWWGLFWSNAIAIVVMFSFGLDWTLPVVTGNSIMGGMKLSPELATLLIGLSIYTAAFIAEVVRGGIQSVSQGQWEAARALGLKSGTILQLIIFPQALRVMIPPLTSEFLNLAKNSSLAIAIGYNDIYAIANTISNQTGKSVEILLIVMFTYLTINLIISAIMNWFNRAVQIE